MTIKKYVSIQSFFYLGVYLSPSLLSPFDFSTSFNINFTTWSYLFGAVFLIFFNQSLEERPLVEKKATQVSRSQIILWGVAGVFLAFLAQLIANVIEQLFGSSGPSNNTQNIAQLIRQTPFFLIAVSIAGPIMEEFVFRRGIIALLSKSLPALISAIISSALFALVHGDGHLLVYFSIGMAFYYLYQKTGSIWTPIIAHCSMNFLVILLQFSIG